MNYTVTRQIGIDAGHRIATHGSKCRHLHGHRYLIEATCRAAHLHQAGEQTGMVLDFGFLKEEMLSIIDGPCDHGFIVAWDDTEVLGLFVPAGKSLETWQEELRLTIRGAGFCTPADCRLGQKLYVVPFQPTAECLARHWFERLRPTVDRRSDGLATLERIRVWETPNCYAEYSA